MFICSIFIMGTTSCERTEIQKSFPKDDSKITSRTDDCNDCPDNDCCCEIEWISGSTLTYEICGATGNRLSTSPCGPIANPPGSCPGVLQTYYLGPFNLSQSPSNQLFCVPEMATFLLNVTGSGTASIGITCQLGQTSPQTIITSVSATNRYYFDTDGSCEIALCQ